MVILAVGPLPPVNRIDQAARHAADRHRGARKQRATFPAKTLQQEPAHQRIDDGENGGADHAEEGDGYGGVGVGHLRYQLDQGSVHPADHETWEEKKIFLTKINFYKLFTFNKKASKKQKKEQ